ncbi:DUF4230 domain-containing protein [Weeksellaceae bacterium KMM 9724]|uniref:DUF4230 domain-containing protein n=1 Tax=Profundicola chukchiensis TaxID=2961959 RepID=UPI002437B0AB|nr:DUF4230 domain-containing protein [Profundicola chukchiensis]MDG4950218.1 DUF4230 domain-containing protein [Profundicola chukchiensis]
MNKIKPFIKYIAAFVAGIILTYFIVNWTKKDTKVEATHTIAYGIERLNKMVVAEQNYANFYSHKSKTSYMGDLFSFDKNLLLKVDIRAQASYDLKQMKVELDSINETIYIRSIPELKLETFSDVEFFEMNQSRLNQFTKDEINGIKKRAVEEVKKTIDQTDLKQQAHEQLISNLEDIYLLAKIYGWKIEDTTKYAQELEQKVKF